MQGIAGTGCTGRYSMHQLAWRKPRRNRDSLCSVECEGQLRNSEVEGSTPFRSTDRKLLHCRKMRRFLERIISRVSLSVIPLVIPFSPRMGKRAADVGGDLASPTGFSISHPHCA